MSCKKHFEVTLPTNLLTLIGDDTLVTGPNISLTVRSTADRPISTAIKAFHDLPHSVDQVLILDLHRLVDIQVRPI